ncbi:MAG: DinB family protein [Thermomicrobiales bacterium]
MASDRAQVDTLLVLIDHTLEESATEFGWDHWHSLVRNLSTVRPEDWDALPVGGGRTIRQLVRHVGRTYPMYANHAFGDGSRDWDDDEVDGLLPGTTPEENIAWLRACHRSLRDAVAALTDADLPVMRKAPWGDEYETRRLIELQIQHALYHVGEINHLRALLQGNDDWDHQDMDREEMPAAASTPD